MFSLYTYEEINNFLENNNAEFLLILMQKADENIQSLNNLKMETKPEQEMSSTKNELCVICLENKSTITFIHGQIGHMCSCEKCSLNFKNGDNCPLCRKKIDNIVSKIY